MISELNNKPLRPAKKTENKRENTAKPHSTEEE
jgi:hypothetical protein